MKDQLLQRISALDLERRELLDELDRLASQSLTAKPSADRWSILEIVEHVVRAEREVLMGLPASVEWGARRRGLRSHLKYALVWFVLRCRIPVKVPAKPMLPTGEIPLSELRRDWDENLTWLRRHVEQLHHGDLRRPCFSHPVAGPIDTVQAVAMGRLHFEVHRRQIRKLRQKG